MSEWYWTVEKYAASHVPFGATIAMEGQRNIYNCPSAKGDFKMVSGWTVPAVGYIFNELVMPTTWGTYQATAWNKRVNPDKVKQANMTLILADGRLANPAPWGRIYGDMPPLRPSSTWSNNTTGNTNVRYWHSNGTTVNVLMVDYSVVPGVTEMEGRIKHYENPVWYAAQNPPVNPNS